LLRRAASLGHEQLRNLYQPDYPPIKKLHTMVSKRAKRRLVVAAARRLAIDLWRWATGRATAQELGLQFQLTNYAPEAKRLTLQQKPIWERRVYEFAFGRSTRPNIRWYRSFPPPSFA
jgi:hypothetical protein